MEELFWKKKNKNRIKVHLVRCKSKKMKVGKFGATCLRINNKEVTFLGFLGLQTGVKYQIMLLSSMISQIRKSIEL